MPVNLEEIVNLFEGLHSRMMQFASLLYEWSWKLDRPELTFIFLVLRWNNYAVLDIKVTNKNSFDLPKMGFKMREIGFQRTYIFGPP